MLSVIQQQHLLGHCVQSQGVSVHMLSMRGAKNNNAIMFTILWRLKLSMKKFCTGCPKKLVLHSDCYCGGDVISVISFLKLFCRKGSKLEFAALFEQIGQAYKDETAN